MSGGSILYPKSLLVVAEATFSEREEEEETNAGNLWGSN